MTIKREVKQALEDCNKKGILYKGQIHRIYEFNYEGLDSVRLKKQDVKDTDLAFAAIKWSEIKKRRVETLPYAARITDYGDKKVFVIQHIDNDNVFIDVIGEKEVIDEIKLLKNKKNVFLNKSDDDLFKMHKELMDKVHEQGVNPNFYEGRISHQNEEFNNFVTTIEDFEDIEYDILDSERNLQKVHNNARKDRRNEEKYHFLQKKLRDYEIKVGYDFIKNWPSIKKRDEQIVKTLEKVSGKELIRNIKQISKLYRYYDPESQRWIPLYSYKEIWIFWRLIQIENISQEIEKLENEKVWEWD